MKRGPGSGSVNFPKRSVDRLIAGKEGCLKLKQPPLKIPTIDAEMEGIITRNGYHICVMAPPSPAPPY